MHVPVNSPQGRDVLRRMLATTSLSFPSPLLPKAFPMPELESSKSFHSPCIIFSVPNDALVSSVTTITNCVCQERSFICYSNTVFICFDILLQRIININNLIGSIKHLTKFTNNYSFVNSYNNLFLINNFIIEKTNLIFTNYFFHFHFENNLFVCNCEFLYIYNNFPKFSSVFKIKLFKSFVTTDWCSINQNLIVLLSRSGVILFVDIQSNLIVNHITIDPLCGRSIIFKFPFLIISGVGSILTIINTVNNLILFKTNNLFNQEVVTKIFNYKNHLIISPIYDLSMTSTGQNSLIFKEIPANNEIPFEINSCVIGVGQNYHVTNQNGKIFLKI
ncbi:hypothetical protein RCL1_001680 [Eukaryota sp. TZLM3-RCL]